jgi:hypothetical protein
LIAWQQYAGNYEKKYLISQNSINIELLETGGIKKIIVSSELPP